ncbi:MAG: SPOR domain-containing protein [Bacteroidia bacterium]|nr:SPOR domain-containing protein [Bacteroidia bacterium]
MAQIDFQSYIALLAAELPRFSVPGVGSFVWHVEKAHVDPRAGVVAPPRPALKYEPGHRFQAETITFLREYFGLPAEEAEALLREIGRLASTYLRATNEMDLWKLGKIKKVGAVYKVELAEEALIPFSAELYEVSLRSSSPAAPVAATPAKAKVSGKSQDLSKASDFPRARVVEQSTETEVFTPQPTQTSGKRWSVLLISIGLIVAIITIGVFWILRKRKPAQPVEIVLSKPKPEVSSKPELPPTPPQPTSSSSPEKRFQTSPPEKKPPTDQVAASPPSPKNKSAIPEQPKPQAPPSPSPGPRYYIIVGSYPSRTEAEAKARELAEFQVEYLPGKEPGWVRLSVFSSSNKADVQRKLREVKAKIPDAWVFTAQ